MSRQTFTIDGFTPDWKAHPGGTLHELLEEFGMTQSDLAQKCGVSQKHGSLRLRRRAG